MAFTDFLIPVATGDDDFAKFAKLQAQLWQCCINAGISIPSVSTNSLLAPLQTGANDFQKFASVQAMLSVLSSGISGGGSVPATTLQAGNLSLTAGTSNLAVAFSTAFAAVPAVVCNLVPPNGGALIVVAPESVTVNGFTAPWGFAIPTGYALMWVASKATQ